MLKRRRQMKRHRGQRDEVVIFRVVFKETKAGYIQPDFRVSYIPIKA